MKRLSIFFLSLLLALSPAYARTLLSLTITTALTAQVTVPLQVAKGGVPPSVTVQCTFTYGSGGTTADAWVQTSLDGGLTWVDIANCHFTTSTARFVYNLSSMTPVTTEYAPTDGTLAANTSKDGILGPSFRAKYTTTGTYAASTTIVVTINGVALTT